MTLAGVSLSFQLNAPEIVADPDGCAVRSGKRFAAARPHSTLYTVPVTSCLFCKIIEGSIPSSTVYEDEQCYAFGDIDPKAPVHVLIVPREHIPSLAEAGAHHPALLGHLLWTAAEIARAKGLSKGYRTVINTGRDGGQSVDHIHVHLLGGRPLSWPPG